MIAACDERAKPQASENGTVFAWGKRDDATGRLHRLEHHCADVAACFEALLQDRVLRARFAEAAGDGEFTETTVARLTYLAFLHDFGKLNAGFQFKVSRPRSTGTSGRTPRRAGHVAQALLCLDQPGFCGLLGLDRIADEWGDAVVPLLYAALAHHGRPAIRKPHTGRGPAELWQPFGGYCPRAMARFLHERGRAWFPQAFAPGPLLPSTNALAHLFAGVLVLADQLGSDDGEFGHVEEPDPSYIERARRSASKIVADSGFARAGWIKDVGVADVRTLFDHDEARPLQYATAAAALDDQLLILESETGSGKTEAAILRFAALWREGVVDGLYFAVPTRAAAKQLHQRVRRAMRRLFPSDANAPTILAVPGYLKADDTTGHRSDRFEVYWEDEPDDEVKRQARWSAESARKFLSAPVAVGTVDQVLLAGLQVKWAHFRAASLARSLLVVDEIHASDAYMTELLRGVLRGHLELGGHALLMSATLGSAASTKFMSGFHGYSVPASANAEAVPYPALTAVLADGTAEVCAIPDSGVPKTVSVSTSPILGDPVSIARTAAQAARSGAKVLVIRNTVSSAQAVFGRLLAQGGGDLALTVGHGPALHHSRFAVEDRELLDKAVEDAIGKDRPKSGGLVIIGTQTLEQSLDIDADLLITDLCPVDVLLQRIGRLHRHRRTDRPAKFSEPRCVVLVPEAGLEAGLHGSLLGHGLGTTDDGGIYENLVGLEATRRLVEDEQRWVIPAMNRTLVEGATHPDVLRCLTRELGEDWRVHLSDVCGRISAHTGVARLHALTREEPFDANLVFPDLDEWIRTRLGEDGPRIELSTPVPGPFGSPVTTFNLPAHLFCSSRLTKKDIDAASVESTEPGALTLTVGPTSLRYDREGVRRQEA